MLKFSYYILKSCLALILVGSVVIIGLFYYYSRDLPDYSQLINYFPPLITRIYSADGRLIEEYAVEHRVFIPINSVPGSLIEAFISAEDKNFFNHPGIDIISIIRAGLANLSKLRRSRRMEGGSTITQQMVKNFLLTNERSLARKIKEAILSYMVSKAFTKEQILELYLNQIFLGKKAYGVAAAAQNYFNKSVDELSLAESALLAALPKAPSSYNPEKHYARSKKRRDYVLIRMFKNGYITEEAAQHAMQEPIILQKRDRSETVCAGYYAEMVRESVIKLVGKEYFYTGGLTVITALDTKLQTAVQNSLRKAIKQYDKTRGLRRPLIRINPANWLAELKKVPEPPSMLNDKLAVILSVSDQYAKIGLIDGSSAKINLAEMIWATTDLESLKSVFKPGEVVVVEASKTGYILSQVPEVNGAMMVMDPVTGRVLATEGGYDFAVSKFDGATQALRQPGSLIKTFIYLAALENGLQPNKIFEDGPLEIFQGPGLPMWQPQNYKSSYLGSVTMRQGLEKSRNLVTIRVAQAIGLGKVEEIIRRFGINHQPKLFYSMVLGSLETTLEKMTTAYAMIANAGKKLSPHFVELIKDRHGKVIYRRDNRSKGSLLVTDAELAAGPPLAALPSSDMHMITDEASNYQITSMLEGVAQRGTACRTNQLGKVMACKTGTSNDSKDAWLVCFTPRLVVSARLGYDIPQDMGKTATGSNVPMPAMIDFFKNAYHDVPSLPFKIPSSIKLMTIDGDTGKLTNQLGAITEAFKVNNLPDELGDAQQQLEPQDQDVPSFLPVIDQSQEIY